MAFGVALAGCSCCDTPCEPGARNCEGALLVECRAAEDGCGAAFVEVSDCEALGGACLDLEEGALCIPAECQEGETRCAANGRFTPCVMGFFGEMELCPAGMYCDAAAGDTCVPLVCPPGATFCPDEGASGLVARCNDVGTDFSTVETCVPDSVCYGGGCLGPCDVAALFRTMAGCVFWALDTNNTTLDDALGYDVVLLNPSATSSAAVTVETRDALGGWSVAGSVAVDPGALTIVPLPDRHAEGTVLAARLAYRVTSTSPVHAWQFNSDNLGGGSTSSGATLLIPAHAVGLDHWTLGLPAVFAADAFGAEPPVLQSSGFAVVGTADGTAVTITVTAATEAGVGFPSYGPGDTFSATLGAGDVLQIETLAIGDDLSGSRIEADLPVAVFAHHECASLAVPSTCDHLEEQIPPVSLWGLEHVGARMLDGAEEHLWRVIASEDSTTISFDYGPGVTGLPAAGLPLTLDAGAWVEYLVDGPAVVGFMGIDGDPGDFRLVADQPVLLMQFSVQEPSAVTSTPVERWTAAFHVPALPFGPDYATWTRLSYDVLSLDGAPLTGNWTPILAGAGPGYEAIRAPLDDGPHFATTDSPTAILHLMHGCVSGGDINTSYAYGIGMLVNLP